MLDGLGDGENIHLNNKTHLLSLHLLLLNMLTKLISKNQTSGAKNETKKL